MALKLPPLSGLRLFEAAARCGSFKQAAHELNLTPGALSHGIDSLENWLDVELFERKAHGIILTAAGHQFLPYVSEALAMIATGTLRLPSRRFEERLSISSFSLFASKVLQRETVRRRSGIVKHSEFVTFPVQQRTTIARARRA